MRIDTQGMVCQPLFIKKTNFNTKMPFDVTLKGIFVLKIIFLIQIVCWPVPADHFPKGIA